MTDRQITFFAPEVRALLDGRKTQTRRVLKPQPVRTARTLIAMSPVPVRADDWSWPTKSQSSVIVSCKPHPPEQYLLDFPLRYAPGDRLWVREQCVTWIEAPETVTYPVRYAADDPEWELVKQEAGRDRPDWKLRPPTQMPRWASRLTLTVTDVRVQRLQGISEADAVAEGLEAWLGYHDEDVFKNYGEGLDFSGYGAATSSFRNLWNSLHGPEAWNANPWVVAISFDVHRCNIDQMNAGE